MAVIGATERPGALGRKPVDYLLRYGYEGRILPVNPKSPQILGLPAYRSVREAPGPVGLALIMVSAERVPAAVDDCVAAGVPVAIIASSGFAETGAEGAALQAEVVARARAGGLRLIGPNCIGAVGFHHRVLATFSPLFMAESVPFEPGGLAVVSQSGALGFGVASLALERGLRPGWVVSTGSDADVTAIEVLRALAEEPGCTGLLAYLETVPDVTALRELAASGKPVALLKSGRSAAGSRAAASHTGALATDDRVLDGALRQYGITRATDVDDLLDMGRAFSGPHRPRGRRVAVVTTSGGSGILAADAIAEQDLELTPLADETRRQLAEIVPPFGSAENPIDITATVLSDPSLLDRSLDTVARDDTVDMIIGCFCVMAGADVDKAVRSFGRVAEQYGKPVLVARTGADFLAPDAPAQLRAAGLPEYPSPARAVRAAAALARAASGAGATRPPVVAPPGTQHAVPASDATEPQLKRLLAAAGLPVPPGREVSDAAEATAAVAELGGVAVLKAVVPGLLHKTEAGGVAVGVTTGEAAEVFARLAALGGTVLVERQAPDGVELIVGVRSTPLGNVLTVGLGGIFTEALDDVACRLLPLREGDAAAMLGELRGARLLEGLRGRPAADTAALLRVLDSLSALTTDWPTGFELDLNPVRVLSDGAVVLDAAYTLSKGAAA
ncbi:acetate--CoA ligase family protein [Winogradskya consettensis]|uniref:6-carboxyhexanoate--CoA ligase n=1 Tax=Winogradskya consettensis TaxID=113560 RepID=A0A919SAV2_9ACTN|nr:6-carboxyhexanoate--CoA ligase [Actinoplanes consettensis]